MITYDVDILDTATGETRRTPMHTGWNEFSIKTYMQDMCDCCLAGYRERGYMSAGTWTWHAQSHEFGAYEFIRARGCDHSKPGKKLRALRAYLSDGRVCDLQTGQFVQAAA